MLDESALLPPDRPGNRQVDMLMNLVERSHVGLVYFLPDLTETLRVNGRAAISTGRDLLEPLSIKGRLPISVLRATVEEALVHCANAVIRARQWDPDAHAGADAAEIEAGQEESARTELY